MSRYLAARAFQTAITLALMSLVVFVLIGLMPGDPIDMMISGDPQMTSEDAARLRAMYGLDKPLLERYLAWAAQALQGNFGYSRSFGQPVLAVLWPRLLNTLLLAGTAFVLATAIALPLGIWAAHKRQVWRVSQPVLDLMQTMPTFVYLIPILILFGLGAAPALIVTIIFAMPAPVRMTYLGITSIPTPMIEAGEAFGATKRQLLWKVELPAAMPSIMAGLTQCIMLSLSMVVFATLIGAPSLGNPVFKALSNRNIPLGIEAGLAIVVLAIILDRMLAVKSGGKK